ncbi:MAG: thioredoxin [Clostridia bacterium]|nr:thioredoxin [Clostridia bacterium]
MLNITKDNFKKEVEEAEGLVVIDLWAEWCGPCRMLAPTLDELEAEYPEVKFGKINVDNEPELARLFKVQSIPFVALVKDNVFVDMSVGYVPKASISRLIVKYR